MHLKKKAIDMVGIGIIIGILVGVVMDNVGLGIALGIIIGAIISSTWSMWSLSINNFSKLYNFMM